MHAVDDPKERKGERKEKRKLLLRTKSVAGGGQGSSEEGGLKTISWNCLGWETERGEKKEEEEEERRGRDGAQTRRGDGRQLKKDGPLKLGVSSKPLGAG